MTGCVVIGCDNAAVPMKDILKRSIEEMGIAVEDMGVSSEADQLPYALTAKAVCDRIIDSGYEKRGVLICGTGIGMCMTANKFKGIRAAVGHDIFSAQRSVLSNNGNVICFGARVIGPELAKTILREWLKLDYIDGPSTPKIKVIFRKKIRQMQKKLYIGTNTKMYKTIRQTVAFLDRLGSLTRDIDRSLLELFVMPSYTALDASAGTAHAWDITLGAQNMNWEDEGQFTGEVSPLMLEETGVRVVCIGHSERRHVFGEDDEAENRKVLAALRHHITPLLCVGETDGQKGLGIQDEILRNQLKAGLRDTTPEQARGIWIAYEPVWAIGVRGTPAGVRYAGQMHTVIRQTLREIYGREAGDGIPILYGGSVNNMNARELIQAQDVDGLFIGRSAWDADNFSRIIHDLVDICTIKKNGGKLYEKKD